MVLGFIGGICWAVMLHHELKWGVWIILISSWGYNFIIGFLFIGFAEVIELLQFNNDKKDNKEIIEINKALLSEIRNLGIKLESRKKDNIIKQDKIDVSSPNPEVSNKTEKLSNQEVAFSPLQDIPNELFIKITRHLGIKGIIWIVYTSFENIYLGVCSDDTVLIRYRGFMPFVLGEEDILEIEGLSEWYENIEI